MDETDVLRHRRQHRGAERVHVEVDGGAREVGVPELGEHEVSAVQPALPVSEPVEGGACGGDSTTIIKYTNNIKITYDGNKKHINNIKLTNTHPPQQKPTINTTLKTTNILQIIPQIFIQNLKQHE